MQGKQSCGVVDTQLQTGVPIYPEAEFHELIDRELRRASRTRKSFLLVLLNVSGCASAGTAGKVASVLSFLTREIDAKGWYDAEGATLGMLCAEFGGVNNIDAAEEAIVKRLCDILSEFLNDESLRIVRCTMPEGFARHEGVPSPRTRDKGRKQSVL
ncbi:MAG TPA: hypothetical protein VMT71_10960 [Syntrophorhabdales bacterium]|nr:hypothetical protein [Syntrophorhabdales bacterium]